MINFDHKILELLISENFEFLSGARLQKIQQPTRQDFVLTFRNLQESRKLYININPNFFHACFMSKENESRRRLTIPKAPPMFCMLLRKYLEGGKVTKVEQPQGERILEFYFETFNELSEKIYLCLAIELMGKHSNVVLYNYDTNVIIGCAHNVGEDKSRERHLIGGLPYVYPIKAKNTAFFGLSAHFRAEIESGASVNFLIDGYFADIQEREKIKSIRQKMASFVGSKLKKVQNSLTKITKQTTTSEKADLYRKYGDLIMANLYLLKDFTSFAEVLDYTTNEKIKIDLDETKTLKDNANRYFKLYNKAKITMQKAIELGEDLKAEQEYFNQVLYSVECAQNIFELEEIEEEIFEKNKNQKQKIDKAIPPALFDISGFKVYLGKNNRQNDYIVSKLAKDDDLWFHTRLCAGSHVLLKLENSREPDDAVIFACAKLAKEHSVGKDSSKVSVIYTKRKFLKKPPGAKLGYVTYKSEKEILID